MIAIILAAFLMAGFACVEFFLNEYKRMALFLVASTLLFSIYGGMFTYCFNDIIGYLK